MIRVSNPVPCVQYMLSNKTSSFIKWVQKVSIQLQTSLMMIALSNKTTNFFFNGMRLSHVIARMLVNIDPKQNIILHEIEVASVINLYIAHDNIHQYSCSNSFYCIAQIQCLLALVVANTYWVVFLFICLRLVYSVASFSELSISDDPSHILYLYLVLVMTS